jgi:hypothetical protein
MLRHARAVGHNVLSRHGTVAAYLALMLASTSVAYAAATIGSPEVIDNSLKSVDLKDGMAVKGVDVVNDSLTGADINESTLSSTLARGTGAKILNNRIVIGNGQVDIPLLDLQGLGQLLAGCALNGSIATIYWRTPNSYVDYWENTSSDGNLRPHGSASVDEIFWASHYAGDRQYGDTLLIGQGGDGGAVRTAAITGGAFRSAAGSPCGMQVTATLWTGP